MDEPTHEQATIVATGPTSIQPLFLLADSQLLFWKDEKGLFLERVRSCVPVTRPPRAAYLGASNGDVRDFFDLFVGAMEGIDVRDCRMIPASPSDADRAFLDDADIVLLAGGDVERGFRAFQASGLADRIVKRYAAGAVLIGISAGAMQLGLRARAAKGQSFDALRLAPMVIDVHDEPEWEGLHQMVTSMPDPTRGLGIPIGAGAVVHADLTVEPVRKALTEVSFVDGAVKQSLLLPETGGG